MVADIWMNRFYAIEGKGDEEPWHFEGVRNGNEQTAEETFAGMEYETDLQPMYYYENGELKKSEWNAIVRRPTSDDDRHVMFGQPVKDYELIRPIEAARLWDAKVGSQGAHVNTMAILGDGERMFITCRLPDFDVNGDGNEQVKNYLLFFNPMLSGVAAGAFVTSIRTVCANTLRAGIAQATEQYTITHKPGSTELLGNWLESRYKIGLESIDILKDAYAAMAKTRMPDDKIKWIIDEIYPMPAEPDYFKPRTRTWEETQRYWEWQVTHTERLQKTVESRFHEGRGIQGSSIEGSVYAMYNAVSEVETFRRGPKDKAFANLMTGDRGERIMKAYDLLMPITVGV